MPPRRPRSTSDAASANTSIPRATTSSPLLRKQIAVASDSIYQNNLTVLKRGDPTITSIIDQFSHVCLYNYNGRTKKWAKEGFEGSMFLVEHVDEPIYGIYILNRMGTGDYIRRVYPEDDMEVFGKYLMYRFYPDFTQKRLAMHLPYPIPDLYRAAFDQEFATDSSEPDDPDPTKKRKKQGNSITLGLWAFQQEAHEPLDDVMMRLREHIKRGERYPEQFRYFPGRQNPQSHRVAQPASYSLNGDSHSPVAPQAPHGAQMQFGYPNGMSSEPSEVDKLFAKLQPPQSPPSHSALSQPASSSCSVESLFTSFPGHFPSGSVSASIGSMSSMVPPSAGMTSASSSRIPLLDSIFASVSHPGSAANSSHDVHKLARQLPPHPEEIQIVSPKPQSSTLPQILNQRVISSLLGLSPVSADSRSSSAALSSSSSQRSGAKRYEGDNELSENDGASEGEYSASSTVLDTETNPTSLTRGSFNLPSVALAQLTANGTPHSSVSVQGDVTPRAGFRGIGSASPSLTPQRSGQPFLTVPPSHAEDATSTRTTSPPALSQTPSGQSSAPRPRALVPFSTDSELWPYPRPPLNDNDQASDADVVELDFSDTRALSDPTIFKEKQVKQGQGEKKRRTRKERAADRVKEREAIENSWDDPTKTQVTLTPVATTSSVSPSQAESSTPAAAPNGVHKEPTGGDATVHIALPHIPANGTNRAVKSSSDDAREALVASLAIHPQAPSRDLSRKQFVQEVLSLIYTDTSFVDKLYEAYCSPAHS